MAATLFLIAATATLAAVAVLSPRPSVRRRAAKLLAALLGNTHRRL